MRVTTREFRSKELAEAFIEGVEFVNASDISCTLRSFPDEGVISWEVRIEVKDGSDDET